MGYIGDDPEQNVDCYRKGRAIPKWPGENTGSYIRFEPTLHGACVAKLGTRHALTAIPLRSTSFGISAVTISNRSVRWRCSYFRAQQAYLAARTVGGAVRLGSVQNVVLGQHAVQTCCRCRCRRGCRCSPGRALPAAHLTTPTNPMLVLLSCSRASMPRSHIAFRAPEVELRVTGTDHRSVLNGVSAHSNAD